MREQYKQEEAEERLVRPSVTKLNTKKSKCGLILKIPILSGKSLGVRLDTINIGELKVFMSSNHSPWSHTETRC